MCVAITNMIHYGYYMCVYLAYNFHAILNVAISVGVAKWFSIGRLSEYHLNMQ